MTVAELLDLIVGPAGALVVLSIVAYALYRVVSELWADHKRGDADDREQRDQAIARLTANNVALERNNDAIEALSAAFREYVTEQSRRQRRGGQ